MKILHLGTTNKPTGMATFMHHLSAELNKYHNSEILFYGETTDSNEVERVDNLLDSLNPDIIHIHNISFWRRCIPNITKRFKTILTMHEFFTPPEKIVEYGFTNIIVPNEYSKKWLGDGIIIPHGYPEVESISFTESDRIRLSYIGRNVPGKGVEKLEEICSTLNNVRLTIYTPFKQDDLPNIMANTDWVVVPSDTFIECHPVSILEAFAYKRPVIVTDNGGMSGMVKDGVDGFVVGGFYDLKHHIEHLDKNQHLRFSERVKKPYSMAECAMEYIKVYES